MGNLLKKMILGRRILITTLRAIGPNKILMKVTKLQVATLRGSKLGIRKK